MNQFAIAFLDGQQRAPITSSVSIARQASRSSSSIARSPPRTRGWSDGCRRAWRFRVYLGFEQLLEYLNTYSHGGIGFEILGIGFDGGISFLEETLEYREDGLSDNLLVIENCDEWLHCIDVNTDEVVSWSIDEAPRVEYACFDDYVVDRLSDAIENL